MADYEGRVLLTLASARRRSYFHALSMAPGRLLFGLCAVQIQQAVSFLPEPGFMKTRLPSQAVLGYRPGYRSSISVGEGTISVSRSSVSSVSSGLGSDSRGPDSIVRVLESSHPGHLSITHLEMDCGGCQASVYIQGSTASWPCYCF